MTLMLCEFLAGLFGPAPRQALASDFLLGSTFGFDDKFSSTAGKGITLAIQMSQAVFHECWENSRSWEADFNPHDGLALCRFLPI